MRRRISRWFYGIFALLLSWCLTDGTAYANQVSLTDLVVQTKQALLKVAQEGEDGRLELDHVNLTVQAFAEDSGGGKLSFWVVTIGGEAKQAVSSKMTLTLAPPDPESASNISKSNLADALAGAILSAGEAIDAAMKGQPPLEAREFTAEVKFALEWEAGVGAKLKFADFGLEGEGAVKEQAVQTIKAVFKRPNG